jgi:subtilase family serine protease
MSVPRLVLSALCALLVVAPFAVTAEAQARPEALARPEAQAPADARARPFVRLAPSRSPGSADGLSPADIATAYGLVGGSTGTVAIATAYSDPKLESDLAVYRSTFDLPACTTADGCLTIVGQNGSRALPEAHAGWGQETSLDVDAVSAACPECRILVVEADSDTLSDLGAAVNTAVRLGADAVSASWGNTEWRSWSPASSAYFSHPGVPVVAATGDSGYDDAVFPAALPNVIAAGGTTLTGTSASSATASAMQTFTVHGGSMVAATTSATITQDKKAVAKARTALSAANRHLATLKKRAHAARVHLKHARTAHGKAVWRRHARALDRSVLTARKSQHAAATRLKKAQAQLLRDQAKASGDTAAAATAAQTTRSGWVETAWRGAGSGCSAFVPKPSWQPSSTCSKRGIADIAAVADPQSGIATYDTYGTSDDTDTGWLVAGGTSLAAPLIAAMLVRSGHADRYSSAEPLYAGTGRFWDITAGSNGSCGGALCAAGAGYDGPTGLGSPRSLSSF